MVHLARDAETKEKVAANLANFAYDPYNYNFLRQVITDFMSESYSYLFKNIILLEGAQCPTMWTRIWLCQVDQTKSLKAINIDQNIGIIHVCMFVQLNVLELFIDCITEPNEKLIEFGVGGICNACVGHFYFSLPLLCFFYVLKIVSLLLVSWY